MWTWISLIIVSHILEKQIFSVHKIAINNLVSPFSYAIVSSDNDTQKS